MPDSPTVPEGAPAEVSTEPEYDPSWIDARPDVTEPAPPPAAVAPQPAAPAPTTPQTWEPPTYTGEQLFEKPIEYIDRHLQARLQPFAAATLDLMEKLEKAEKRLAEPPKPAKAYVDRAYKEVAASVKETIKEFTKDPAFHDKNVKPRVEAFIKASLQEAYKKALDGNFEDLDSLQNRNLLETMFDYMKKEAGIKDGPAHVEVPGAKMQEAKPRQAKKGQRPIDDDTMEVLKKFGISTEDYLKNLEDAEEDSRKRG